jgi:hypothetical protein
VPGGREAVKSGYPALTGIFAFLAPPGSALTGAKPNQEDILGEAGCATVDTSSASRTRDGPPALRGRGQVRDCLAAAALTNAAANVAFVLPYRAQKPLIMAMNSILAAVSWTYRLAAREGTRGTEAR